MENQKMNDIKVTDKYTYQKMSVNITEEIKHFRYNGIDGEYIIKDSIYETNKYLQYGDLSAVTTQSGKWIVDGNLTDELASAFNLAFKESFEAKEGITILSYMEELKDLDYITATWNVLYKGKLGSLEVEYNYGDGGYPEYLKVNLDGISGTATGTKVDLNGDIPAEIIKRIEDITGFEIKEEAL